jgi:hypothetical protein
MNKTTTKPFFEISWDMLDIKPNENKWKTKQGERKTTSKLRFQYMDR